jgi:DNA repair exonuclease SbcCD ATPase subunit
MGPQVSAGFRQAKERLETWNELKARLPQQQEELSRQNYQLRQIEHALASVEVQLEQLESFSLGGLLDAMLGKKEGKIRALKDEAARLQTDLEAATGTLTETDSMVRQIEQQLVAMGDPQKALAAQLEAAERALLEAAGESPTELSEVNSRLTFGRARRRELQKAVQIGKHLIERLHNMTNSLGRTQQKLLFGGPLGVVGTVALNAAARHGTGARRTRGIRPVYQEPGPHRGHGAGRGTRQTWRRDRRTAREPGR